MLFQGMKALKETLARLKAEPGKGIIRLEEEGIHVSRGKSPPATVRWSDVRQIFEFKEDLFSVDLICLGFRISDNGEWVEVDEEMEGYDQLLSEIERRFSISEKDWFQKVAVPAFERNFKTLWGKPFDWKT